MSRFERTLIIISLIADLLAITTFFFPGLYSGGPLALLFGLSFSLAAFFSGWFYRASTKKWGKALAWTSMMLGALGILYFLPNLFFRVIFDSPFSEGDLQGQSKVEHLELTGGSEPDALTGQYTTTFDSTSDSVKVLMTLSPQDSAHVATIVITKTVGANDRIGTLNNVTEDAVGFLIAPLVASDRVVIDILAVKRAGAPLEKARLTVTTRFYSRTTWWEYKRWLFRRYP